ncbi:hypothetical protein GCM10023116_24540 [Kistimonas scapharcae]|uniref:Uncharacterized protein n=1 Tax=Kistimonas scapharcae TaxID=1036133 RepID=A0ABP8V2K8_9GAMM
MVEIPKNTSKQGDTKLKDKNSPNGVEHSKIDFTKTKALATTKKEWQEEKKKDHEHDSN